MEELSGEIAAAEAPAADVGRCFSFARPESDCVGVTAARRDPAGAEAGLEDCLEDGLILLAGTFIDVAASAGVPVIAKFDSRDVFAIAASASAVSQDTRLALKVSTAEDKDCAEDGCGGRIRLVPAGADVGLEDALEDGRDAVADDIPSDDPHIIDGVIPSLTSSNPAAFTSAICAVISSAESSRRVGVASCLVPWQGLTLAESSALKQLRLLWRSV
jgi:hypothetical protein